MRAQAPAAMGPETLEFSARPSWLAMGVVAVAGLIVLVSAYILMVKPVPIALVGLLIAVMGSCGLLALSALNGVFPAGIEVSSDGLELRRLLGSQSFSWSEVEDVKLVPAPGTFADDPARGYASRIGIGLFLNETAKTREDANLADVVLCVGTDEHTDQLMRLVDRISMYRERRAPKVAPRLGARRAVVAGTATEFRRKGA